MGPFMALERHTNPSRAKLDKAANALFWSNGRHQLCLHHFYYSLFLFSYSSSRMRFRGTILWIMFRAHWFRLSLLMNIESSIRVLQFVIGFCILRASCCSKNLPPKFQRIITGSGGKQSSADCLQLKKKELSCVRSQNVVFLSRE